MATKNRRAAVYLPPDVDNALAVFKDQCGLEGDSQALIAILREFFGLGATTAYRGSPDLADRVTNLERNYSSLEELRQQFELWRNRLAELQQRTDLIEGARRVQALSPSQLLSDSPQLSLIPGDDPARCLNYKKLAKRLGVSTGTLGRRKREGHQGMTFEQWSEANDPDGLMWSYDSQANNYKVVSPVTH